MSKKLSTCLWFSNGEGEEAANFYVSLLPDSRIDGIMRSPGDNPGGKEGSVLAVDFTFAGQEFMALNGDSSAGAPSHMTSIIIYVDDQAELDRLWEALGKGGKYIACGWLMDRWGHHWQITPRTLPKLLAGADRAKAKRVFNVMMDMVKLDIAKLENA
jgi:predicted 3-demethylubiquinone-9 3-methyltransferase (glyoxalase superfamily)